MAVLKLAKIPVVQRVAISKFMEGSVRIIILYLRKLSH